MINNITLLRVSPHFNSKLNHPYDILPPFMIDFLASILRYSKFHVQVIDTLIEQFSDRLIVVSYSDREKGLRNHIGNDNKYMLIRYGINLNQFNVNGRDIKEELGLNKHDLAVGMISCFKPQKSPGDFIKLAYLVNKTIADVKFILIGDGVLRKDIERLILKFKLQKQVILLGWRNDIPAILSAIDIFVLTSLWEGLPITALEAIASFKPVVATDTGGISEIIQEGNTGFLVPPRDMNNMAEKLRMLLGDESLRRQYIRFSPGRRSEVCKVIDDDENNTNIPSLSA